MSEKTFDYRSHPKRVNLGCGHDKRDGFLNIDLHDCHAPDLVCDVTDLGPLPSSYYEHVLAQDILEHIPRLKTRSTLKEWNRILATGGTIEVRVPSVIGIMHLLLEEENQTTERQERLIQCLFGTQCYDGDFHYIGFTEQLVHALFEECGFRVENLALQDRWLFHITARKVADAPVDRNLKIAKDEDFLVAVYEDLLARKPDSNGFDHYLKLLKRGIVREAVIESIKACDEYRKRQPPAPGPSTDRSPGRQPRSSPDQGRRPGGLLRQSATMLKVLLKNRKTDHKHFLTNLYRDLLHREPDDHGLRCSLRMLNDGVPRYRIVLSVLRSDEYLRPCG